MKTPSAAAMELAATWLESPSEEGDYESWIGVRHELTSVADWLRDQAREKTLPGKPPSLFQARERN